MVSNVLSSSVWNVSDGNKSENGHVISVNEEWHNVDLT